MLWLGGLVGWSIILYTKGLWIQSPSQGTNFGCGSMPRWGTYGRQLSSFSLTSTFLSLSPFLSIIDSKKTNTHPWVRIFLKVLFYIKNT